MIRLWLAGCLAAALLIPTITASAQTRTIRIIVPFGPGGGPDTIARVLGEQIAKARGVAVVIENRPGAGSIVATEATMRAAADGNTLLIVAPSFLVNPHVRKVAYNPLTDFDPICHLVSAPPVLALPSASPHRTLGDLLKAARAKPGSVTVGGPGPASTHHLIFEALKGMAKVDMTYVPYPTTPPAVAAALGGHVTGVLSDYASLAPQLKGGQLRPLVVASSSRMDILPNVPTLAEAGHPGLEFDIWFGVVAPAKTPKPSADELIASFRAALQDANVKTKLNDIRMTPVGRCGGEFAAHLRHEYDAFGRIIREAKITVK
jgi:tripartite-type tricarboxylate transporter receptor subunit TctC